MTAARLLCEVLNLASHGSDDNETTTEMSVTQRDALANDLLEVATDLVLATDTSPSDIVDLAVNFPLSDSTVAQLITISKQTRDADELTEIVSGLACSTALSPDARRRARKHPRCTPEAQAFSAML